MFIEAKDNWGGGSDNWTTGAISRAKKAPVKSSPPTNQLPCYTGRMPFLSPNQQCQSTEGKVFIQLQHFIINLEDFYIFKVYNKVLELLSNRLSHWHVTYQCVPLPCVAFSLHGVNLLSAVHLLSVLYDTENKWMAPWKNRTSWFISFFQPITQWCSISDVLFTGGRRVLLF